MVKLKTGPINAATPTPLESDGALDRDSSVRLCRRWMDIGLDGVFILGSMGEGEYLSEGTRDAFVEAVLEEVRGKLTIFAGAMDTSRSRMRDRALRYAGMGVSCVVLGACPGVSGRRAIQDVKTVADACPVPCSFYHVPSVTGIELNVKQLLDLLSHPNIHAIKDSSANPLIAHGITTKDYRAPDIALFDGCEYRTAFSHMLGYDGVIHGGGVLTARRVRHIWDKVAEGHLEEAIALDRENSLFLAQIYNRLSGPVQNVIGLKYALKLLGVLDEPTVAGEQSLDEASRARIAGLVERHLDWLVVGGTAAALIHARG